jgi:hypothetical protein
MKQLDLSSYTNEKKGDEKGCGSRVAIPLRHRIHALVKENTNVGGVSVSTLARILKKPRQMVYKSLKRLQRKGFVDSKNNYWLSIKDMQPILLLGTIAPDWAAHHISMGFPIRSGSQPHKFAHHLNKRMRGFVQYFYYFPHITITSNPHMLKVEVHGITGVSSEEEVNLQAREFVGRVLPEFCQVHGIVVGEPRVYGRPHLVKENRELSKKLIELFHLDSYPRGEVGATTDASHLGKLELIGAKNFEGAKGLDWLVQDFPKQFEALMKGQVAFNQGLNSLAHVVASFSDRLNALEKRLEKLEQK